MIISHKARTPEPRFRRQFVTKANAILSWTLRHDSATPEQRDKAMRLIEQRFKGRE